MKNTARIFIWILFIFGGGIASYFIDRKYFISIAHNTYFHIISFVFGFCLFHYVLKISKNTGKTLARYGRKGNIPRMQTNKLVTTGIYSKMRHPMHLGLLFFPLSIAMMLGFPTFIFIIWPIEAILMILMIKFVEEPEAIKKFGDEYLEYKKNVPWFCIKFSCLKELINGNEKL